MHRGGAGRRPGERDDVRSRRERVRGDEHLVALRQLERQHREVQRRRPRGHGHRVLDAARSCEQLLELGHLRAHRELARLEHLLHRRELLLADVGKR